MCDIIKTMSHITRFWKNRFAMKRKSLLIATFALLITGCSRDIDFEGMEKKSGEEIFSLGEKEMKEKHYSDAAKVFEELERLYPYSKLTAEAQLKTGECYYRAKKYNEAVASFEIFVKTHPTHEKTPYAVYMLGLINYQQMPIVERDQEATVEALSYFKELCERYPESKYVNDAEKKIKEIREQLAGREVYVARYYQRHKNYAAAIGRLNTVVEMYQDTAHRKGHDEVDDAGDGKCREVLQICTG
ncbi:MAG: outer membrane protein assembly factor BamD, partial [Holosporales bacterium]|nr:outer membrane protein assembly factor BamD [Holosporales bacterium]